MGWDIDIEVQEGDALIVADVQNDFLPDGALGIEGGDAVIGPLNRVMRLFAAAGLPIFCSRDWHPDHHCSFTGQGGIWPDHCIAGTVGAEFAAEMDLPDDAVVISKATNPDRDAYSALEGTDLGERLEARQIRRVFVGGLATDYCVRATVLDLIDAGFDVVVIDDAIAAVDAKAGDGDKALRQMVTAGATRANSSQIVASPS